MTDRSPRCGMASCTSGLPGRPYPCGIRCARCCPSTVAGEPHPDVLAARVRAERDAYRAAQLATKADREFGWRVDGRDWPAGGSLPAAVAHAGLDGITSRVAVAAGQSLRAERDARRGDGGAS